MRFCLTLLLFAVNTIVFGQFSDDFGDGDFTNAPTWSGDAANFVVNGSNELQLMAPAVADTSYLSVPTTNINNTTWDFYVRMDFNPSASNLTRVYLVSDNADLKGNLNGYFVMLGGTPDEISLYRQDGTATTEIIDGLDDALDSDPAQARVRVTRDGAGNWELFRDTLGGTNFFSEGTVNDVTHTATTNFGVFCKYTSSRSDKFFFDDLGDPYVDGTIPTLDTAIVISSTQLDVQFSESMDQITAETLTNYSVDQGIGTPTVATLDGGDPTLVHLTFGTAFTNGNTYLLTANNVEDLGGNPISSPSTESFTYIVLSTATPGDVIITEFMADPSPSVGQPEVEYVEIFNATTSDYFDLSTWEITDGSSTGFLDPYILGPGEYVLITGNGNGGQFFISNYMELSLPTLTNGGDNIVITDGTNTIDSLTYDLSWYNDPAKEDGGWSIEKMNYTAPCQNGTNWSASADPLGGTPGLINSVFTTQPDATAPFITSFTVNGNNNVVATYNEELDTSFAATVSISPSVTTLNWNYLDKNTLNIDALTMQPNQIYTITVSGATDCSMNSQTDQDIQVGIPDSAVSEDLIINEVMFNPLTNGSDYVEIYNNSNKILDLSEFFLANWDDDSIANYEQISSVQYLILPQEYVLLTEDTNDIINDFAIYGVGTFVETDLPTYPNDSGTVYLISNNQVIDLFHYDEDYHFELLTDEDGKSLERIDFNSPQNDPSYWHTASELVEWGTPGYENSQLFQPATNGTASVDPQIFSPDNDGYQDVLTINLELSSTENVVDIEIFDNQGRMVRLLEDNFFAGNSSSYVWDGITDNGEKASVGTYVILVSVVDENGNQEQYKLVAVLATQF